MAARHEHYMPLALLDSQFATLEEPRTDENPIEVAVRARRRAIVRRSFADWRSASADRGGIRS